MSRFLFARFEFVPLGERRFETFTSVALPGIVPFVIFLLNWTNFVYLLASKQYRLLWFHVVLYLVIGKLHLIGELKSVYQLLSVLIKTI